MVQIKMPYIIDDKIDKPVSLYAATKASNELMAYTYSHLSKCLQLAYSFLQFMDRGKARYGSLQFYRLIF